MTSGNTKIPRAVQLILWKRKATTSTDSHVACTPVLLYATSEKYFKADASSFCKMIAQQQKHMQQRYDAQRAVF